MPAVWILELTVLLVAIRRFARIAATPAFRIETVWRPGWKWPLVASASISGVLGLWAAVRWPLLRHIGATTLAAVMALAWWRARPWYGRFRRLPPGSLGIGESLDALRDQGYYLARVARFGPVFKTSEFGHPVICVVGLSRARAILAEHGASFAGSRFTRSYQRFIPRGVLRYMDRDTHKEYAPRFRGTYDALELERGEPLLRTIYRANLARLAADSIRTPDGVAVDAYLRRAMLEAVGYLFYGLTPGDARLDELERCMPLLNGPFHRNRGWERTTREAMDRVAAIMAEVRPARPGQDGDGFRPALQALREAHPVALDDPTIAGNFMLISQIAYGDLTGLHTWIFKKVSDHRSALDPVRCGIPDAGTRIVMETLRMEQSEFLFRAVIRTFEYEGMRIPAGWMVRFCTHESHRDPAVFSEPDRFNPERFAGRTYSREEYAPFGADAHACMGSHIAHYLGRLFVEELARGYDWRVVADGPPEPAGNRHRAHWRPSTKLRVAMSSRGPEGGRGDLVDQNASAPRNDDGSQSRLTGVGPDPRPPPPNA